MSEWVKVSDVFRLRQRVSETITRATQRQGTRHDGTAAAVEGDLAVAGRQAATFFSLILSLSRRLYSRLCWRSCWRMQQQRLTQTIMQPSTLSCQRHSVSLTRTHQPIAPPASVPRSRTLPLQPPPSLITFQRRPLCLASNSCLCLSRCCSFFLFVGSRPIIKFPLLSPSLSARGMIFVITSTRLQLRLRYSSSSGKNPAFLSADTQRLRSDCSHMTAATAAAVRRAAITVKSENRGERRWR